MRRREPEHVEQAAFMDWVYKHEAMDPRLLEVYAVPSGRWRTPAEAGKLKAEGVRPGRPDLNCDIPRVVDGTTYHGWRCEMKAPGRLTGTSQAQKDAIARLRANGYWVVVCDRWQEAWNDLAGYLGLGERHRLLVPPLHRW